MYQSKKYGFTLYRLKEHVMYQVMLSERGLSTKVSLRGTEKEWEVELMFILMIREDCNEE